MAQSNDRRRYGYTDGSLAYDLDALARERALDDAGRMEPQRREPVAAPRRQSVARPAAKLSPLVLACAAVLTGLVVVLLMGYVRLTEVSADISQIKTEMGQLEERHVALLTQYEKTFDLATVKRVAEEAGMKFTIHPVELRAAHPNTAVLTLKSKAGRTLVLKAASVGGGRIRVTEIDGVPSRRPSGLRKTSE